MKKSHLIVGASHVAAWSHLVESNSMPALSEKDICFGINALPLFSAEARDYIEENHHKVDKIILFVSDFRFGNRFFEKHNDFESTFIYSPEHASGLKTHDSFPPPDSRFISLENDSKLYNNALLILDYYIKTYQDKISFIFWDLNVRETINILKNKYIESGKYHHPVWNYDELVARYKNYTYDVSIIREHLSDYLFDQQGHPNMRGFCFLWHLIALEAPESAYLTAKKKFAKSLEVAFSVDETHEHEVVNISDELSLYSKLTFPMDVIAFISKYVNGKFIDLYYGVFSNEHDDIIQAQHNLSRLIFKHLHYSPAKLLQVGIGFGHLYQSLINKGFDCTGISMDPAQVEIAKHNVEKGDFKCASFDNFVQNTNKNYDVILFIESTSEIDSHTLLNQSKQLLKSGGSVLVVDTFSTSEDDFYHNIETFKLIARDYNFKLTTELDLSDQAFPTFDFLLDNLNKYANQINDDLDLKAPMIYALRSKLEEYKLKYKNAQSGYYLLQLTKA